MSKKQFTIEQIITKLREAEVSLVKGSDDSSGMPLSGSHPSKPITAGASSTVGSGKTRPSD